MSAQNKVLTREQGRLAILGVTLAEESTSEIEKKCLCDCNTKVLYGMRMIGIQPKVANELRDILERQDEKYENWQAVETMTTRIMDTYTTADMMKNTKMYAL